MGIVLGVCLLRSPTPLRKRTGSLVDDKAPVMGSGALPATSSGIDPNPTFNTDQPSGARDRRSVFSSLSEKNFKTKASSIRMFTSPRSFFADRKPLWWAWWLIRAGALVGVIIAFIVLINSFYSHHDTQCPSCKYLSCLPVSNWCEIGDLTFNSKGG